MKEEAEEIRIRYKYRKLIQSGKLRLPHGSAVLIIGPDCAYHLYSKSNNNETLIIDNLNNQIAKTKGYENIAQH